VLWTHNYIQCSYQTQNWV